MAKQRVTPRWAQRLQAAMPSGWSCWEDRGNVRVAFRRTVAGKRHSSTSTLSIPWAADAVDEAIAAVGELAQEVQSGIDLKDAVRNLRNTSQTEATPTPTTAGLWPEMVRGYQNQLQTTGNQIGISTWKSDYARFLDRALALMSKRPSPANALELAEKLVMHWSEHPRSRALAVKALTSFLQYGIRRHGLPALSWTLDPAEAKRLRGRPPQSRTKSTLSDTEILGLIESLPANEVSERWGNALKLLALYGLRPEELHHLSVREHPNTGGPVLFCSYSKVCGSKSTEPRWLLPVPLLDAIGDTVQWNLAGAMAVGQLPLPPLGTKYALLTYLTRQPRWQELKTASEKRGEWLRPYVFRDSYSIRAHKRGLLRLDQICAAMGHSLAVHQSSYVWANEATVLDALT